MFTNLAALTSFDTTKFNTENTVSMERFLYRDISLPSIDFLNDLNTSNVQNMKMMVKKLPGVTGDVVFRFDTKNVTTMEDFASEMSNVNSADFSHLDTSKVRNMLGLCFGMTNATSINLSGLDTSQNENFYYAFGQLKKVTELDLSSFDTSKVKKMEYMFTLSNKLETIYVGDKFVTTAVNDSGNRMFEDASKLVGSAGSRLATYWSQTNVAYARIDDLDNGKIGYFTPKNARYIRYDANEPYGETATGQTRSHYASSVAPYTQVQENGFAIDSYRFLGWGTSPDSVVVYEPGALIDDIVASKEPYTLYAKWEQVVPPTLMQSMLNDKLKEIVAAAGATDNDVVAVKEATNPPAEQLIDDNIISSPESSYKIWAYYAEGTIWIYTEDGLTPHAPDMLGNMLSGFPNLTDISWLSKLDVSNTTNISSLFDQDASLTNISPLANWDTSKLISILGTFRGTAISDLSPIATKNCGDKTCWDTSNLEDISSAFQGMTNLSNLSPLATWNASKLNDLSFAFYDTGSLTDFSGISGWRLKETGGITMLMTFDNRNADYAVLENWFSERANGTEGLTMTSAFPNIDSAKLPSWAQ